MATRIFRREQRLPVPVMPSGPVQLRSPPQLPNEIPANVMQVVLPGVMLLGSVGFIFIGGFSAASLGMGSLILLSTVGMMTGGMGGRKSGRRAQLDTDRKDYLRYLDEVRGDLARTRSAQRDSLLWSHPDPRSLWSFAGNARMWERRSSDVDFASTRVAVGAKPLCRQVQSSPNEHTEGIDPLGSAAARDLASAHSLVPDLPVTLPLRACPALGIRGPHDDVRALVRAMIVQLITFHGPDQLVVGVVTSRSGRPDWDWVKWLPHNQDSRASDAVGSRRLVTSSLAELTEWLADDLSTRSSFSPTALPIPDQPHIVIVIDGGTVSRDDRLPSVGGLAGVTIIDLSDSIAMSTEAPGRQLVVADGQLSSIEPSGVEVLGRVDGLSIAAADSTARRFAPWRVDTRHDADNQPLRTSAELMDLLGLGNPANLTVDQVWRSRSVRDSLRVPIGVDEDGRPMELDLKEAALGGMGPHGLVVGATGSGKSELLRTTVLGLALTHAPDSLNLILIDFKGGATFQGLAELPHTAAVITNLQDDLTLVDRMHDALAGEMNRRQELLRSAGNFASVREYEQARKDGAALDPLPSLVIVCDEFSEMLSQKPEFAELFVAIGRLGRSLSMHLMLASQRLEEGRLRGLDSQLSYRIGLKTFSAAESRTVLGVSDAYELPAMPGSGFLRSDGSTLIRFKAAYVSGAYPRDDTSATLPATIVRTPLPFLSELTEAPPDADCPASLPPPRQLDKSVLDVVVDKLQGRGRPAHEIWLPPLSEPPSLDSLLPPLTALPGLGLTAAPRGSGGSGGGLVVPIGIVDRPYEQRRDELLVDFSGSAGNGVVVGGPQSGKSTVLRDVITSLALTHTPREVQIYGVDLGGGSLASTAGLPHVGAIASRADPELVRRIIAEVSSALARREQRFRMNGVEAMTMYRQQQRAGRHVDDPFGDIFLIIDGWATFRAEFEDLEQRVTAIANQGLSFGVHVILAANRWAEIRAGLKDTLGTRVELRLGDPTESEIDRRAAAAVPRSRPGRGLTQQGLHFLAAVPRIDASSQVDGLACAYADLVEQVAVAWQDSPAPRVRILPGLVAYENLPAPDGTRRIPIGLDENELAPVLLDFDVDPHFVFFADGESGKTTLLKVIAAGIRSRYTSAEARILLVDYRRTMLGTVPPEYLAGYAATASALGTLLDELRPLLRGRLPGPDVTPAQLRDRSWWRGPEIFVLVDDYDLVASLASSPLAALAEFLPQAKDVGCHLIICRRSGGAARALFDPVLQHLRESSTPGIVGSGNRDEGDLLASTRPTALPPGRGVLVGRRFGAQLIQIAAL